MTQLIADQKDIEFILYEQLNAEELLTFEKYKDLSRKTFNMIISEARKVGLKEILPTLVDGDRQGVRFENGKVSVPESFHRARQVVKEADLTSTMEDPDWGGQGLPFLISMAIMEYTVGANYALSGYIHMGHGTGKMIEIFGTDRLKKLFLENLYTAKWAGTMLLTEPESIPIIRHPDVRRMLTWMKAHVDGMRSMIYYVSLCIDKKDNGADGLERERAGDMIELLTPVVKAYCAERGFEVCVQAVQTFGGYGYTKEFPVEQLVRDVKIASIYEGTNGIQAMDFLGRKIGMKKGLVFKALLDEMGGTIAGADKMASLKPMAQSLNGAVEALGVTAMGLGGAALSEKYAAAFAHAHTFLEVTGDVVMGWMHLWRALTAVKALEKKTGKKDRLFYEGIVTCARFYMETVLPVTRGKMVSVQALSNAALSMDEASFD